MKKLFIIPLVFLLCLTFGCQQGEEAAVEPGVKALSDGDVAAIRATSDAWIQAVKSGDWDTAANLYTEDTIVMPPNQSVIKGREAAKTFLETYPPIKDMSFTLLEIDGYGDIAYVQGTYLLVIQPEGAPEPIQDTGKFLEIRRKQEDGSWLYAIDIFNSDLPLPPPPKQE
ncbi:YybH family protein [Acidobacteriota bacterium]